MEDLNDLPYVSAFATTKKNQRMIGAAVFKQEQHSDLAEASEEKSLLTLKLYEFFDNDQYSQFDCFLNQIGSAVLFLPEEINDKAKGDNRKLFTIASAKDVEIQYQKKGSFAKKAESTMNAVLRLIGNKTSHTTNSVENEMPVALGCLDCLIHSLKLLQHVESNENVVFQLSYGSLNTCMRLDSAAAEAVNLLPKPDHPNQYGSLFGILNRCKTKLGSRLLERWLRQPLLDAVEINHRLDIVQLFYNNTHYRNELREGALRAVPDLDAVIHRMHKPTAGLEEVFRLYFFVRSIPTLTTALQSMVDSVLAEDATDTTTALLTSRYLSPLSSIAAKFSLYEQLVEHVVDISRLPELRVNSVHDPELQELEQEQQGLAQRADRILAEARSSWGSFTDIKLEPNSTHGFILRTPRADDERTLRTNNSSVRVISILKNGVHFTTPALERISERSMSITAEYNTLQAALVTQALETARTYLPVVSSVANLISELDVLTSFATAAALAPGVYTRPIVLEMGSGVLDVKGARHPCVELMDTTAQFISNDYDLIRDQSSFQIITGPNMGGKSTYIRGIGCLAVLAQVGSFVPCDSATVSVTDCILARVGAGDAVQKGVSTFMAEMLESAVMLQTATKDSLIIIDELGRGTSTFDGFGLAWSISDYIINTLHCSCLFATHFHELTALQKQYPVVRNKHVSAHVENNQVHMLYTLAQGPCTQSFGIHVAQTADFPACVIAEAKRKAHLLEHPAVLLAVEGDNAEDSMLYTHDKVSRMRTSLDAFAALPIPSLPATEVVQKVRAIVA